jgi:mRNA interferase RelE/StbE
LSYQVELAPAAVRQLKKLTRDIQQRIVQRLEELAQEPRPDGVVKLEGVESLYRIRLGDYRIVYQIQDEILLIMVVKIAHRREVYR